MDRTVTVNRKGISRKAKTHEVITIAAYGWKVTSGSSGNTYYVAFSPAARQWTCTCEWSKYRGGHCSHVEAVIRMVELGANGRATSFHNDEESARRQHRPTYTAAQGEDGTVVLMTTRKVA